MRIALVHDYIKEYGGAERVLEALREIYPEATVFTLVYLPEFLGPHKERFKDWKIKTSLLQHIPFNHKLISPFRLISPFVFGGFSAIGGPAFGWDFSDFDVVIVSATGAYFPNMIKTKKRPHPSSLLEGEGKRSGALHISYCHTPPRYLYGYATARDWQKNKVFKLIGPVMNHFLRMVDFNASKHVDYYIANSEEVKGRIQKFYRRDATVIYPPVGIPHFQKTQNTQQARNSDISDSQKNRSSELSEYSGKYYLTGGRLARAKHIDLIVRACRELNVKLKVFGRGFVSRSEIWLRQTDNYPNIQYLGEVSDEEKRKFMEGAKAFLFASEDEDFGIIPVEAMSVGTPVIAYKSGGVKETVVDGQTGVFFDMLSEESLIDAIKRFEKMKINPNDCRKQAEKFSKERFQNEIKDFINTKLSIRQVEDPRKRAQDNKS